MAWWLGQALVLGHPPEEKLCSSHLPVEIKGRKFRIVTHDIIITTTDLILPVVEMTCICSDLCLYPTDLSGAREGLRWVLVYGLENVLICDTQHVVD